MATSLLNGKWPLLYQVWQKGHFIAKWQMATSLSSMANGHFTNMAVGQFIFGRWPHSGPKFIYYGNSYVIRVKNGQQSQVQTNVLKTKYGLYFKYEVFEKRGWALET